MELPQQWTKKIPLLHDGKFHSANSTTQKSKVVYILILNNNLLRNEISRNHVNGYAIE